MVKRSVESFCGFSWVNVQPNYETTLEEYASIDGVGKGAAAKCEYLFGLGTHRLDKSAFKFTETLLAVFREYVSYRTAVLVCDFVITVAGLPSKEFRRKFGNSGLSGPAQADKEHSVDTCHFIRFRSIY